MGAAGYFCESSISVVVVQKVLAPVGDKNVLKAIVVIVTDTHALSPTRMGQACLGSDVAESAVPIIVKQLVGGMILVRRSIQSSSVHQKDVQPSIIVVVDERHPRAGGLKNVLLAVVSAAHLDKVQTCFARHVSHGIAKF